jgi:hypothetical protein
MVEVEIRAHCAQLDSREIGSREIGSREIGSREIGSREIGSPKIDSSKICTKGSGVSLFCKRKSGVWFAEVDSFKVGFAKI